MNLEQHLQFYRGNRSDAFVGAAANSKTDFIEELLSQGIDINCKDTRFGRSALHAAAANGSKKAVEFLLKEGADINAKDGLELTPLMTACSRGKKKGSEIAEILLAYGPDVKYVRQSDGMTAYKFALWGQCSIELLSALENAGASLPEDDFRIVHLK